MITRLEYEILKEIKRYNDDVKLDIPFTEVTGAFISRKTATYHQVRELLILLIKNDFVKCDGTNEVDIISPLIITEKGRDAMFTYEHKDDPVPAKGKFVRLLQNGVGKFLAAIGTITLGVITWLICENFDIIKTWLISIFLK